MGVVSEDDDYPDAILMLVDIKNKPEQYKYIIRYLKGMNFSNDAIK